MAIAATTGKTANNASATTTLAFTATAITGGQNIVVAVALADTTKTVTGIADTAGNTFVLRSAVNGTGVRSELWEAQVVIGHATDVVTITFSGAVLSAAAFEAYSGVAPQTSISFTPIDVTTVSDLVPHNLTSNTSSTPIVIATSSHYATGDRDGWRMFNDGLADNDDWLSLNAGVDWYKVDLGPGVAKILGAYRIIGGPATPTAQPKNWTMEGSNDNIGWTVVHTVTNSTGWGLGEIRLFFCSVVSTAYRYFRFNMTANNGFTPQAQIVEMDLYEYASPQLTRMGAQASTALNGTNWPIYNAVYGRNNNPYYGWASANVSPPHTIDLDLGRARTFNGFRWTCRWDVNGGGQPWNWEVYVSDDGVTWGSAVGSGFWGDYRVPAAGTRSAAFASQTKRWFRLKYLDQSWDESGGSTRYNYAVAAKLETGIATTVTLSAQATNTATGSNLNPGLFVGGIQERTNWVVGAIGFVCNSGDTVTIMDGTQRQSLVPALTSVGIALVDNAGGTGAAALPLNARISASRQWAAAGVELRSGSATVAAYLDYTGVLPIAGNPLDKEQRIFGVMPPWAANPGGAGSGPTAHGFAY